MKILAVIPARKNSKSIKNKNLKKIGKGSLVEKTIKLVKKSKIFDAIILTSDDKKILKIGKKFNLITLERKKKLSSSKAKAENVWYDAHSVAEKRKNKIFDFSFYLEPTSPMREVSDLDKGLKKILGKKFDTVLSISKTKYNNKNLISLKNSKKLRINFKNSTYHRNGIFYLSNRKKVFSKQKIISGKVGYVLIKKSYLNIDYLPELYLANFLLNKNL